MHGPDISQTTGPRRPPRLMIVAALAVTELFLIILAYQVFASIECRQTEIETACRALRSMTARGLSLLTVLALFFWLRPNAFRSLADITARTRGKGFWLSTHIAGLALIFAPLPLFGPEEISRTFTPTLMLLASGGLLSAVGAMLWITPLKSWHKWLLRDRFLLPMALALGFLAPDLANLIRPAWEWSTLSSLTFFLVFLSLISLGFDVGVDPPTYVIGVDDFFVQIASQCSGVEGIALITIFMGFYALLMRPDLRQQRFWLILYPLAVLASWLFNILRISILIVIGARVSPEHALNGFHSYAGWLMFTALALAVVIIAHRAAWLHRSARAKPSRNSFRADPLAACIVPFIVMMLSGVIASAFWPNPADGYPLRAALMAAALFYFLPALQSWAKIPSVLAVLGGLAIGALWVATASGPSTGSDAEVPHLTWVALRLLGTILLVPLIEELFFRGYVLRRLRRKGLIWTIAAIALSSLLFGMLHERFVAGVLAGVVFALLYLQRNRLADPIAAHVVANAVIAMAALLTGKWALI